PAVTRRPPGTPPTARAGRDPPAAGPAVTWSVDQVGDGGDARLDGPLAYLAEPQHELRGPGRPGRAELAHPVQADPPLARGRTPRLPVRAGRQVRDGMETRGKPGQPDAGGVPGEDGDELGPAAAVGRPHPAEVAVVPPRFEQGRQHQLIQGG